MCLDHALFILQNKSYFIAQYQGYHTPRGAVFMFYLQKDPSLAFRYVNKDKVNVVKLENYEKRKPHTKASFMFELAPVNSVRFNDDCVCTEDNEGHL